MIKEFNSQEEIEKYYNKETNTYVFKENGDYIDLVKFNFSFYEKSNIDAGNINAGNINALDIDALDINALDINARDINARNIDAMDINAEDIYARNINAVNINYLAVCVACYKIICNSIKGDGENAKCIVLDGELKIKGGSK